MSKFDDICKELEQMDNASIVEMFNRKSVDVLAALIALSDDEKSGINAYLNFVLASVAADGVLSEKEFQLMKPLFDKSAGADVTYEDAVKTFNELGLDKPEALQGIMDVMVDIIGLASEDIKADIVTLCLLVCAIDGEVSEKEKAWIKQLIEPLTIQVDAMDVIYDFLDKAKAFMLATTDGDQPRMRVLGLKIRLDGKIYFGVGTFKDVYKQLQANPKCEILASVGMDFLRWDGKAVFTKDERLLPIVENMMPQLVAMYKEMGWEFGFFTLEEDTAEIVNVSNTKKKLF